jgi:hypothetical protein
MSTQDVSLPTATAVFVGAAVLFGVPITLVVLLAVDALLSALDVTLPIRPTLFGNLVAVALAATILWLWLQISYEVAQVSLYGVDALRRGPRRAVLTRYLLFGGLVVAALSGVTLFGFVGVVGADSPIEAVPGLVLGLAGLAVFARAGIAFREGLSGVDSS